MEIWIPEPWMSVVLETYGIRYIVDVKLRHFRRLSWPYEVIQFDSDQGLDLCGAVGIVTCDDFRTSVIVRCRRETIWCVRCGEGFCAVTGQSQQAEIVAESVVV